MPIHRERYRRRETGTDLRGGAWLVIARNGLRTIVRQRAFLGLMLVAWIPAIVRGVQIYAAANLPQAAFLAVTPRTFRDFLDQQELFVFFVTVYVGSGLIADDIRVRALQLYLSRPVTRAQYIAGKFAVLFASLALVTWLPAMMLFLLVPAFAGNMNFVRSNFYLVPAIAAFSILQIAVAGLTILALSCLSKSRWFVAVAYAGVVFFTQAVFAATRMATDTTSFSWIAIFSTLAQVGDVIFRFRPRYLTPPILSVLVLAGVIVASLAILNKRIRAIEVVT